MSRYRTACETRVASDIQRQSLMFMLRLCGAAVLSRLERETTPVMEEIYDSIAMPLIDDQESI